jgi:outer membrane immunogenic protein
MRGFVGLGVAAATLSLGLISIEGGLEAARAADIPRAMPVKAPVVVAPAYSWSGFYIGGHAGYGWSDATARLEALVDGVPMPLIPGDPPIPDSYKTNPKGFIGGGQIGFNHQFGRYVAGIEADVSFSGINGSGTYTGLFISGGPPVTRTVVSTHSQKLEWLATIRGRLGFTPVDTLLIYATGGVAFARVESETTLAFLGFSGATYNGSGSANLTGWTAGGGAEYGISRNLTVKFEYLYVDLPKTSVVGSTINPPFQTQAHFEHNTHVVRVGLNYKFNWAAPVVARY